MEASTPSTSVRLVPEAPVRAPRKGRVAVTAFGLPWAESKPIIDAALHYNARRRRSTVLVLTDATPAWLVTADTPVELLPRRKSLQALDAEEWQLWITRRWEILRAKWDIRSEIALGQSFDGFVMEQTRER